MSPRDVGLPISSSEVNNTQIGRGNNSQLFLSCLMTARNMARLAFMSKTPGPKARPSSSTRNGIRSSVPRGQTVSKWPRTRAGRRLPLSRKSAQNVIAPIGVGNDLDRGPQVQSIAPPAAFPTASSAALSRLGDSSRTNSPRSSTISCWLNKGATPNDVDQTILYYHNLIEISRSVRARIRSSTGSTPSPGPSNTLIAPSWARIGGSTMSLA